MRVGTDDADRAHRASPSIAVEAIRLNGRRSGAACSAPITIVSPGPSMYWLSRCTSRSFSSIISSSARSVARETPSCAGPASSDAAPSTWNVLVAGQLLERRARQPQRARQQLVVERALLLQPREHRLAHLEQRQPGKLGVQVVARPARGRPAGRLRRRPPPSASPVRRARRPRPGRASRRAPRTRCAAGRRPCCRRARSRRGGRRATRDATRWPADRR